MAEGDERVSAEYLATGCVELVQQAEAAALKQGRICSKWRASNSSSSRTARNKTQRTWLDGPVIIHGPVVAVIKAAKRFC